ncbi:MAG: NADPH-dependent 7-cyano-7-deazaguanine reductase QueF [Gammaproteobacteria bacterium RIFCSPHIGHO2_12_FULL_40_19]|nr:MAG: NADPH-dependent 7-cyano-7-deazaguanine reductase QueF [Gammaproteobacteria bacterium RIFCSPHIGHO2_12_FULL_40_19]
MTPEHSPLGKTSAYIDQYTPNLLFPISRKTKRDDIGVSTPLPFYGYDVWNAFEISWLNTKGKPIVAMAEIIVPAISAFLIESKSLKLYFNSFNQTRFETEKHVQKHIIDDLSHATQSVVNVNLFLIDSIYSNTFENLKGICLDDLDIEVSHYQPNPQLLFSENKIVSETVHSHLLKSNCLVTGQPDWGSVEIEYTGHQINHAGLLQYLISFRNHNEFHEQCVERIFMDITRQCKPAELNVYARYTRRGGLDINPYRSSKPDFQVKNPRLLRQ